jgi:mRNA interferase HigB
MTDILTNSHYESKLLGRRKPKAQRYALNPRYFLETSMRFIKKVNLELDLDDVPPEVRKSTLAWLDIIQDKDTAWDNFFDVRKTYNSVDRYKELYIFNLSKGYRLIVGISFKRKIVYYKALLSHAEYDQELWKSKYDRSTD